MFKNVRENCRLNLLRRKLIVLAILTVSVPGFMKAQTITDGVLTDWKGASGDIEIPATVKLIAAMFFY